MLASKPNPKHLALLAIAGATLAASTLFIPFMPFRHIDSANGFWVAQWANRARTLAILAPFALGCALWFFAYRQLNRYFTNDFWSEAELGPVRALMAQRFWTWISLGCFAVVIPTVAFSSHNGAFIYLVMLPMYAVSGIRHLLAPPVERTGGFIDGQNFEPLHSDHWGEPVHQHNQALRS